MKRLLFLLIGSAGFVPAAVVAQAVGGYHVANTFHIASSGGWDYLSVGPGNNRLYVSHGTQVNILDQKTGDSTGVIPNTTGVHGIAFAQGKGYVSNGRLNSVTVFDLKTNQVTGQIATGQNPDAIMFEPFTKTIITCNGRSGDLSVIDPATDKVIATIAIGGKLETAVSDGAGHVFVNVEDKNEIVEVDIKNKTAEKHWALSPAEGPTGLAIDPVTKRLFAGCDKLLVVVDAGTGAIVEKLPIGADCDGVAFDSKLKNIFAACGEGTLAIVHEDAANKFTLTGNLATKKSARTLAVDESTHAVYLPAAEFGVAAAGQRRPPMVPGTFQVVVVEK
ncbi:MAG TPA: DUF5074 domain-containing protein [Chitinophagaceae bacterium]|nr:DUF5074 domain-containing protein [Chitinophagaceae bacterium]